MANFIVHFLDSDDDLSLLTQENRNRNVNAEDIDVNMENLMDSSIDSAVGSLASFDRKDSESEPEMINVAEHYKPMVEDISDEEG